MYLKLNATEDQAFEAVIDTMGLAKQEEVMEIVTSWHLKGAEAERRKMISGILKVRFGNIDASLEAIIPQLMQLTPEEYTDLLLRVSREELLLQFQEQS